MQNREQTTSPRIARAIARARACAAGAQAYPTDRADRTDSRGPATRRLAIGDPQASAEQFFAILEHNRVLGDDGWLAAEVFLLSMGDHFDWGAVNERRRAADDGLAILAWLAAHPDDRVGLILGNHDLGRVGELADFADDASFTMAHQQAVAAYRDGDVDTAAQKTLLERYPCLPTAELAARDFAAFTGVQRTLVRALLETGRLRVAVALDSHTLACHAGVTSDQLTAINATINADGGDAFVIEHALAHALATSLASWNHGPLFIPGLHRPGDRQFGEGGGMFYHRPANPDIAADPQLFSGPYPRRFDPRRLPPGVTQIVGHISDAKCRRLLGPWADSHPTAVGQLRHLRTDGAHVRYAPGLPTSPAERHTATMIFTDGGMSRVPATDYQLLDLSALP